MVLVRPQQQQALACGEDTLSQRLQECWACQLTRCSVLQRKSFIPEVWRVHRHTLICIHDRGHSVDVPTCTGHTALPNSSQVSHVMGHPSQELEATWGLQRRYQAHLHR